jgi:hypothetical protein
MPEGLHGWDGLLRGLLPRLVGLEAGRDRLVRYDFPAGGPIVHLTGGRATGKTAALTAAREAYGGRIPVAHADLAAPGFGSPAVDALPDAETPNASPVTDLLYLLIHDLGLKVPGFWRPLVCPRVLIGLLAVTSWETTEGGTPGRTVRASELAAAQARLAQFVNVAGEPPDQRHRREQAHRWVESVGQKLSGATGNPVLEAVVSATVTTVAEEVFSPRAHRGALRWWAGQPVGGGDGLQRLGALARAFRHGDRRREQAEELLVTAFLEDIGQYYGWWRDANQKPRPLVLLDNCHSDLGRHFLDLLQTGHARIAARGTRPRLVVVAASLGASAGLPGPGSVAERTGGWHTPGDGTPGGWVLPLAAPALGLDEVDDLLSGVDAPTHTARVLLRVAEGRGGSVAALAGAVAERLHAAPEAPLDLTDVFDLPAPGGTATVAQALLEQLIPDPVPLARLTLFSAALDHTAAELLTTFLGPRAALGLPVLEAEQYLREAFWGREPWPGLPDGPFVADPGLRPLLLHRLRASCAEPAGTVPGGGDDRWARIHRRLRSCYDTHAPAGRVVRHSPPYLFHSLALGEVEPVVRSLHALFADGNATALLTAVNLACAAPAPPGGYPPDPADAEGDPVRNPARDPAETVALRIDGNARAGNARTGDARTGNDRAGQHRAGQGSAGQGSAGQDGAGQDHAAVPCPSCGGPEGRPVHGALETLVRALWQGSDPLAPPDAGAIGQVGFALSTLSQFSTGHARSVYFTAHTEWPSALNGWTRAPGLPIPSPRRGPARQGGHAL